MLKKPNLIFLCNGNSARSQMAEAFLRKFAGDHFNVFSAGFEVKDIHPLTIQVMEELGFDISDQYAKPLSKYLGEKHFGIVITVCEIAEKKCPTLPGVGTRLYWPFEDPTKLEGTQIEKINKFREIRDAIRDKLISWLKSRNIAVDFQRL